MHTPVGFSLTINWPAPLEIHLPKPSNIYRWISLEWIESLITSSDLCIHPSILSFPLENPSVYNVLSQKCGRWHTTENSRSSEYIDQETWAWLSSIVLEGMISSTKDFHSLFDDSSTECTWIDIPHLIARCLTHTRRTRTRVSISRWNGFHMDKHRILVPMTKSSDPWILTVTLCMFNWTPSLMANYLLCVKIGCMSINALVECSQQPMLSNLFWFPKRRVSVENQLEEKPQYSVHSLLQDYSVCGP